MVTIRPAVPEDVASITRIGNALIPSTTFEWTETPHSLEARAQWLDEHLRRDWPVLVAVSDDDDKVIGWAAYGDFRDSTRWPGYRFTVEHSIHVEAAYWGQGVADALMDDLIECARTRGKRVMVAAVASSNPRSFGFHARHGFVEVARMPGVGEKFGEWLDLILMQYDLAGDTTAR